MRLSLRLMLLIALLAVSFSAVLATEETTATEEAVPTEEASATEEAAVVDDGDIEGEGSLGGEESVGVEAQTAAEGHSVEETDAQPGSGTLELLMLIVGISAVAGVGYFLYQREENNAAA